MEERQDRMEEKYDANFRILIHTVKELKKEIDFMWGDIKNLDDRIEKVAKQSYSI